MRRSLSATWFAYDEFGEADRSQDRDAAPHVLGRVRHDEDAGDSMPGHLTKGSYGYVRRQARASATDGLLFIAEGQCPEGNIGSSTPTSGQPAR